MTVKKYITWVAPVSTEGYTHTEVWKSTNSGTTYTEFTTSNDPGYGTNGIAIATSYAVDIIGDSGHYYKIRFYDSTNSVYSDWSDAMRGSDFRGYCTITDVRNYTNVQSAEYSDAAVQLMIDIVTASIDRITGRTWQGVQTATDEYHDGSGETTMFIHNDMISVTALSIDETRGGTYTTVTASYVKIYTDRGYIYLNQAESSLEVSKFPQEKRSVKISYTYGHADPTDEVRHLAMLMVANMMKMDATRTSMIEELKAALRINSYELTPTA